MNRLPLYPYAVDRDYEYNFSQTDANISDLNLKAGTVCLTRTDTANQSAFLKVQVRASFLGKYFQPSVKISTEKLSFIQYFEQGAKGTRYINISPLVSEDGVAIRLQGKHVALDDQIVQLIRFNDQPIKKLKIMVLAPHPDDAEIAAFGLYSTHPDAFIVTITAGDAGEYKYDEIYPEKIPHYLKKGQLRTWNSITVPMLGGIPPQQTLNLGFFDARLKKMFHDKSAPVKGLYTKTSDINTYRKLNVSRLAAGLSGDSSWNWLVKNLGYLLESIKPDIIVAPYPALDSHADHKFSTIALFEAIKASEIRNGHLYLYSNHFALNESYPHGKEGGTISLPPSFGEPVYFDSIYSHPLSSDRQKDKIFALEAMNDLRPDTEWRFLQGAIKISLEKIKQEIMGANDSYYRRSIRCNEFFFVVKTGNIYNQDIFNRLIGNI